MTSNGVKDADRIETGSANAPDVSEVEQRALVAEANELALFRRLYPYLDAEVAQRDRQIEQLRAEVASLKDSTEGS